jgi:hypothetical protein
LVFLGVGNKKNLAALATDTEIKICFENVSKKLSVLYCTRVARWFVFKPKIPIWVNFGGSYRMENARIFYDHLKYFTVIWYILWPFGNVVVIWYIFLRFGILCQEKSGNYVLYRKKRRNLKLFVDMEKEVQHIFCQN